MEQKPTRVPTLDSTDIIEKSAHGMAPAEIGRQVLTCLQDTGTITLEQLRAGLTHTAGNGEEVDAKVAKQALMLIDEYMR